MMLKDLSLHILHDMLDDGKTTQEKVDKMDVYVWKKDFQKINNKELEFEEKEKMVFPIILGQCSPSLRLRVHQACLRSVKK